MSVSMKNGTFDDLSYDGVLNRSDGLSRDGTTAENGENKPYIMDLQLFAEGSDDSGAADASDGAQDDGGDIAGSSDTEDATATDAGELAAQLADMQARLAAAEKKRKEAEAACTKLTREKSQLKRSQMTEAEQAAEREREAAEKAQQYDRMMSSVEAEKIFVGGGLKEDDYKDFLEMIVSEDKEKSIAIAQGFMEILSKHTTAAAKAEREKVLKETPAPPVGGKGEDKDPFVEGFKAG